MSDSGPHTWVIARLCDVADVVDPNPKHRNPQYHAEGFPFVSTAEFIEPDTIRVDTARRVAEVTILEQEQRCRFTERSILFSRKGTIGKTRMFPAPHRVALLDSLCVVNPHPLLSAEFVNYCLRSDFISAQVSKSTRGVALKQVSVGRVRELSLWLPPANEQRRIVSKIESLSAHSKKAKAALDAVPPLLDKLRQSILAAAFRGDLTKDWRAKNPDVEPASALLERIRVERRARWEEAELAKMRAKGNEPKNDKWKERYEEPEPVDTEGLPELPEGWAWASLDEVSVLVTSGSRGWAEYYSSVGPLFIRSQDINTDVLNTSETAHVALPQSTEGVRTSIEQGDILITITGANVTRAARVASEIGEAYCSQHVALVRLVAPAMAEIVHLYLLTDGGGRGQLREAAYGGGKPGLNLDNIREVFLPILPEAEIACVADMMRRSETHLTCFAEAVRGASRSLPEMDASILSLAFQGKLVPQDPTDEPASTLLARIKQPPDSAVTTKQPRKRRSKTAAE